MGLFNFLQKKNKNIDKKYDLGCDYLFGNKIPKNEKKAHEIFMDLAVNHNHYKSQTQLGYIYSYGQGVTQNYTEGFKWFMLSAEQGHDLAQDSIGNMYMNGNGVDKNLEKAKEWYYKAAEQGFLNAQSNLGSAYSEEQNHKEAIYWYTKAADKGYAPAQFNLGLKYAREEGVPRNIPYGLDLIRKAAAQGLYQAQEALKILGK